MLDNKRRQILFFVSLIGIVVVSTILLTTYAYQSVQVEYKDGSDNELTVTVGNLDVTYASSNVLNLTSLPLLSSYEMADYTEFTVSNTESTDKVAYSLSLKGLSYSKALVTKDFKYTLTLVNSDGSEEVIKYGNFSELSGTEFNIPLGGTTYRYLNIGDSDKLRLYFWIKETGVEQPGLENTEFKGKINITSLFANEVDTNVLADVIMKNANNLTEDKVASNYTQYKSVPDSSPLSLNATDERVLSVTTDDFGASYYYRGKVMDNYLEFNGMCFRIVRIEGDGAVKITLAAQKSCKSISSSDTSSAFIDSGEYGYLNNSLYFDYENTKGSTTSMKYKFNKWLDDNFSSVLDKLEYRNICMGDLTNKYTSDGMMVDSQDGYYFNSYLRLHNVNGNGNATLLCGENDVRTSDTRIFPLMVDEVIFAGNDVNLLNENYYLFENASTGWWWTITPMRYDDDGEGRVFLVDYNYGANYNNFVSSTHMLRPSLSLKSGTLLSSTSGDGTINSPYIIE